MKKLVFFFASVCIAAVITHFVEVRVGIAKTTQVVWLPFSHQNVTTLRLFRSTSSLTCSEESWDVSTNETQIEIDTPWSGSYFYSLFAIVEEGGGVQYLSEPSNEVLIKHCDQVFCNHYFNVVSTGPETVWLDFDIPPSIHEWEVKYSGGSSGGTTSLNISGPITITSLEEGDYTFTLFARDAIGRAMTTQNTYLPVNVTVQGGQTPPERPMFGIESQGLRDAQTLLLGFEWADTFVSHVIVDVYSSSYLRDIALSNNTPGDIWASVIVSRGTNFCRTINGLVNKIVFVRARAVDYNGLESTNSIDYRLMGDIVETSYEGVHSQDAVIDDKDRATFVSAYKTYSAKPYTKRSTNFCADPNLFSKMPFHTYEVADYNYDGFVNTTDYYAFLKEFYGNSGAGK